MLRIFVIGACLLTTAQPLLADAPADPLQDGFDNPPAAAWPRTWWHWTRGAVRKEGITKDLEWMKRVGIAGFQLADVNAGGGQQVETTIDFGTPAWRDAVKHAASEAQRLGLEMAVFSSPGWSITGGPWVEPHQAMKRLAWSETRVSGPQTGGIQLQEPPANTGTFQDLGAGRPGGLRFYRDVCVLAFRTPESESAGPLVPAEVTASAGDFEGAALFDRSYAASLSVRSSDQGPTWLEQRFDETVSVSAVTIAGNAGIPVGRVSVSDDGESFHTLLTLPGSQLYRQARVRTFAIPPATGRFFRLELTGAPLGPALTMSEAEPPPAETYSLSEWRLESGARVHRWEEKAGFGHLFEYVTVATPPTDESSVIPRDGVLDLTDSLQADGVLEWDAPEGGWTVVRFGYALTGARNRPATPAGSGLEVDKLSREHTSAYYDSYASLLREAVGDQYGVGLSYWLIDSWEAGTQNWTDDMLGEFARRRGYDLTPYLLALIGRVVDSASTSDRFLWDYRRTLADMYADNHYGVLSDRLAQDGLAAYSEASGVSLEIPEDTLLNKSRVAIPMGEFWVRDLHPRLMYLQDVRGAASAAHAYGKPIIAAESFTGGGYEAPFTLKKVSDYWFAQGLNRLVFHTSAHQPLDDVPGNTMVGTHLHRNITWAEQARPLNEYFARVCFMLQQGQPVVDVAYLLDEGVPSTPQIWGAGTQPEPPSGYKHDFLNTDVLLNRLTVSDGGALRLPEGVSYRVLVLPTSRQMRPEVIAMLLQLVHDGATIVGPPPIASPSLMGQPAADTEVADLVETLWGDLNGTTRTVRHEGAGTVVWGRPVEQVLERIGARKDFDWAGPLDTDVAWTHRRTADADIYYLSNLTDHPVTLQTRFRVASRGAELWRPDTGGSETISAEASGETSDVSLDLQRNETVFVVFRGPPTRATAHAASRHVSELVTLPGPWKVSFPPERGAPAEIELSELASWTQHTTPGVRYFSGTATYSKAFTAPDEWLESKRRLELDLGEVRDLAKVSINGEPIGLAWKPPYRVDITDALMAGENVLDIRVTNQWTNRIAGDAAASPNDRVLSGGRSRRAFGPRRLAESGLIGPVRVLAVE